MKILIRPLDTKKTNEQRCPEVGLGILDFVVRTVRPRHQNHAKRIGFSCVFGTSRKTRRRRQTARLTGQGLEALFTNSPQKIDAILAEK